jgi:hypothetical protein
MTTTQMQGDPLTPDELLDAARILRKTLPTEEEARRLQGYASRYLTASTPTGGAR